MGSLTYWLLHTKTHATKLGACAIAFCGCMCLLSHDHTSCYLLPTSCVCIPCLYACFCAFRSRHYCSCFLPFLHCLSMPSCVQAVQVVPSFVWVGPLCPFDCGFISVLVASAIFTFAAPSPTLLSCCCVFWLIAVQLPSALECHIGDYWT